MPTTSSFPRTYSAGPIGLEKYVKNARVRTSRAINGGAIMPITNIAMNAWGARRKVLSSQDHIRWRPSRKSSFVKASTTASPSCRPSGRSPSNESRTSDVVNAARRSSSSLS